VIEMAEAAYELLIDAARASCGEPQHLHVVRAGLERFAEEGQSWPMLLATAGHHGLLPGLTSALRLSDWQCVPPAVRERLEARHQRHVRTTLSQVSALYAICGRFREAGVPAVSWKGPLLAHSLYGSYLARESGDLDFLMDPDERIIGATLLRGMGFRRHRKTRSDRLERKISRLDGDQGFIRASDNVYVELHTQPMPARFTNWQLRREYLRDAEPAMLDQGTTVLQLRPQDLLLSLAGHAIKHHWERLKWVQDIALFLRVYRHRMDWAALLAETRESGKSLALVHTVALAATVFDAAVPGAVQASPELARTSGITQHIARMLRQTDRGLAPEYEIRALTALLQPSPMARLRFTLHRALEPQLCDFNDSFSRSPLLCKWHRVAQQVQARGLSDRTTQAPRGEAR
jgi:hypothetical protein